MKYKIKIPIKRKDVHTDSRIGRLEGGKMLLLSQVNSPLKILALTWGICDHKMVSAGFQQGKLNKKGESKCYR